MDNLSAFETTNHMNDSVYFPDMREKFVPEPFSFGSAFDQSGDIYKLDNGRSVLIRIIHFGQHIQPPVRHRYDAYVWFDGAKRIIGRLGAGIGNGVKKGAFTHIG